MSQLIDGDLAANNGGWQWPLQPVPMQRRIFVFSTRQPREKFDRGEFIRQWLPELRDVPGKSGA